METEVLEKPYQVKLGEIGYFEFDGFRLNKVLFANIRSLNGKIGDVEFDYSIIRKLIMDFLRNATNIELVNILSRELNGFDYFDIYEKSVNNELKIENVLGENEVPAYAGSKYLRSITSKSNNSPHLIPSEVISKINSNIPLYRHFEIDQLTFYPIWYINGNRNNGSCELFCHFNILIHLLSKIFVEFKSQILDLAGIDIQKAIAKNQTVEKYLDLSKEELINKLKILERNNEELTNKNIDLNEKFDAFRKESKEMEEKLNRTLEDIRRENRETHERLDIANANLEEVRNENRETHERLDIANANLNIANTRIENLTDLVAEVRDQTIQNSQAIINQINEKYADAKITTGSAKEVLLLIESRELTENLKIYGYSIYDTISCQIKDRDAHLKKHGFNSQVDRIVRSYESSNSIDLSYFMKTHLRESQAYLFSNSTYRRKLVYRNNFKDELLNRLDTYIESIPNTRVEVIQTVENTQATILRSIERRLGDIEAHVERIENRVEAIEEQLTAIQELARLALNNLSILLPNRNRRLKVYLGRDNLPFVNLNKSRHYLTEDEAKFALDHK